jgi:hypothetical protein
VVILLDSYCSAEIQHLAARAPSRCERPVDLALRSPKAMVDRVAAPGSFTAYGEIEEGTVECF